MTGKPVLLVTCLLCALMAACAAPQRSGSAANEKSQSTRTVEVKIDYEDVIAAAMDTRMKFMESNPTSVRTTAGSSEDEFIEIPKEFWAEHIVAMDPLRVYPHFNNMLIVTNEDEQAETGLYIQLPISSLSAQSSDTMLIEPTDDHFVYRFTRQK